MRLRYLTSLIVLLIGVLAYVAWNRSTAPVAPSAEAPGGSGAMPGGEGDPGGVSAAPAQDPGVEWRTPKRWVEEPASGMRLATYLVPPPAAGGEGARCAVYYFGPGQGGGTEANIERWIGEFESPGTPKRRDYEVRGLMVAQVEVAGTYLAHAGATEGAPAEATGWTLLGAIVEGPGGAVFFKLAGPTATVAPAAQEFEGMLASLRRK